jgi:phthalate 4,5-cis-dihydrodiol dehydrogenase
VRALQRWHHSDWFHRARAHDELLPPDGGVVLRQGVHEFDVVRMLLPDVPVRVRGVTAGRDPDRPGESGFQAWVEGGAGTVTTVVHQGHDFFRSEELTAGLLPASEIGRSRRRLAARAPTDEAERALKRDEGHPRAPERRGDPFGFTLVSGDRGDLRPALDHAVLVYDSDGRRSVTVDGLAGTALVLDELYGAVSGRPAVHDGAWGLACLELALAVRESALTGEFVTLYHQAAVDDAAVAAVLGPRRLA